MDKDDADVDDVTPSASWICSSGQRMSVSERAERLSRLISNRQCRCSRYEKETNAVIQSIDLVTRGSTSSIFLQMLIY